MQCSEAGAGRRIVGETERLHITRRRGILKEALEQWQIPGGCSGIKGFQLCGRRMGLWLRWGGGGANVIHSRLVGHWVYKLFAFVTRGITTPGGILIQWRSA